MYHSIRPVSPGRLPALERTLLFICENLHLLILFDIVILWPWQQVLQTTIDPEGQARPIQTVPITPAHYQTISGDSQWLGCLLSALLGAGVVISLQGLAGRSANVRDVDAP